MYPLWNASSFCFEVPDCNQKSTSAFLTWHVPICYHPKLTFPPSLFFPSSLPSYSPQIYFYHEDQMFLHLIRHRHVNCIRLHVNSAASWIRNLKSSKKDNLPFIDFIHIEMYDQSQSLNLHLTFTAAQLTLVCIPALCEKGRPLWLD